MSTSVRGVEPEIPSLTYFSPSPHFFSYRSLQLATTWPPCRADALFDNPLYTELLPASAPSWSLRAVWENGARGKLGMLGYHIGKCNVLIDQIIVGFAFVCSKGVLYFLPFSFNTSIRDASEAVHRAM